TRSEPIEVVNPAPGEPAAERTGDEAAPTSKQPAGEEPMPDSIGVATMESDGTIVLDLRATGPGVRGDARLRYPKDHAEYDSVLKHLGGLKPGQKKPVPPWPDDE